MADIGRGIGVTGSVAIAGPIYYGAALAAGGLRALGLPDAARYAEKWRRFSGWTVLDALGASALYTGSNALRLMGYSAKYGGMGGSYLWTAYNVGIESMKTGEPTPLIKRVNDEGFLATARYQEEHRSSLERFAEDCCSIP